MMLLCKECAKRLCPDEPKQGDVHIGQCECCGLTMRLDWYDLEIEERER